MIEEHDIREDWNTVQFIMMRRLNDTMMLLLREMNPDVADKLAAAHERGIFVTPPPAWRPGEDEYGPADKPDSEDNQRDASV